MLPDRINEIPPKVLSDILKALNIDYGDFMYRLFNDHPKEIMMYAWIYKHYHKPLYDDKKNLS